MISGLLNSKSILARDRSPWVDYIKGICIILVCFRHVYEGLVRIDTVPPSSDVLDYLNLFFFSFRMPLFFIVSGLFLGPSLRKVGFNGYFKLRVQTIFYPFVVWGFLHITLQLVFKDYVNANREPFDYLRLFFRPRAIEQFWYLNALFFVGVLYAFMNTYARFTKVHQFVFGSILYTVAALFNKYHIEGGFLYDVFVFYLFFTIGDILTSFILNKANEKLFSSWKLLLIILPFFLILQNYFTRISFENGDDYYVQRFMPVLFILAALVGGAFIVSVAFILQKYNWLRFLRVVGYHSLYIYVANLMVTSSTRVVLYRFFHIHNIYVLLVVGLIAGTLIPMLMYGIAQKAGAWWLYTLKKPKKSEVKKEEIKNEVPAFGVKKEVEPLGKLN